MIPVSMVVYWMMIFWLKQSGLLNDDILIKTKWYLWLKKVIPVNECVNGGLLNDDILIKTKWYLCQ